MLQHALIRFSKNRTRCVLRYNKGPSKPINITENMICAGGTQSDSCQGDSGGPLTCYKWKPSKEKPSEFYLCGIVSFGKGCRRQVPGIYTDVSKYYEWIRKIRRVWSVHDPNDTVDQSSEEVAIQPTHKTTPTTSSSFLDYPDYGLISDSDCDGPDCGEPGESILLLLPSFYLEAHCIASL